MDLFPNPSSSSPPSLKSKAAGIFFMSMGFLSTLVLLKVVIIPFASDFVLSTFPRLFTSAKTSLSPAFVLIILNSIIISILASSSFHHHHRKTTVSTTSSDIYFTTESDYSVPEFTQVPQPHPEKQSNHPEEEEEEEKRVLEEDSVLSKCANDYVSPEADDTLDATWRAIMEGQGKMEKPRLKKSDTCGGRIEKAEPFSLRDINNGDDGDGDGDDGDDDPVAWARRELKKSETFNDTVSLRRDKSMSPEELNLRAEAFIQNFINQMRLQRLESEQRFMELVNRSA